MLALLLPLLGFALLDSLNVLNLGVTTAVVYDSRLGRRSALPSGLSFVGGVFTAITTFGILTVLGLNFLTDRFDLDLTPPLRYWGQLALGVVLITVAVLSSAGQTHAAAVGGERGEAQPVAARARRARHRLRAGADRRALPDRAGDAVRAQPAAVGVAGDRDLLLRR